MKVRGGRWVVFAQMVCRTDVWATWVDPSQSSNDQFTDSLKLDLGETKIYPNAVVDLLNSITAWDVGHAYVRPNNLVEVSQHSFYEVGAWGIVGVGDLVDPTLQVFLADCLHPFNCPSDSLVVKYGRNEDELLVDYAILKVLEHLDAAVRPLFLSDSPDSESPFGAGLKRFSILARTGPSISEYSLGFSNSLPLHVAVDVLLQMINKLEIIHNVGLVHRNVNMANLFFEIPDQDMVYTVEQDRLVLANFEDARYSALDSLAKQADIQSGVMSLIELSDGLGCFFRDAMLSQTEAASLRQLYELNLTSFVQLNELMSKFREAIQVGSQLPAYDVMRLYLSRSKRVLAGLTEPYIFTD